MHPAALRAFREELTKIAMGEPEGVPRVTAKMSPHILQKGDILLTKIRKPNLLWQGVGKTLSAFQGTDYYHSALYAGDGEVVHGMAQGIQKIPLKDFNKKYTYVVYSPKAGVTAREKAVDFMNSANDKKYSIAEIIRLSLPVPKVKTTKAQRIQDQKDTNMICSSVIAQAYPSLSFADRETKHIRPIDFANSNKVEPVVIVK